jgi:ESF2/ABP1 family protein
MVLTWIFRWSDDIWTMKYLSGFKWEMLGEQVGACPLFSFSSSFPLAPHLRSLLSIYTLWEGVVLMSIAYERQAHQARLRNEITQSRAVQGEYLRNVELARVLDKRRAKKAESDPAGTSGQEVKLGKSGGTGGESAGKEKEKEGMKGRYRQREAVDRASGLEKKGMDSVLGSVFG